VTDVNVVFKNRKKTDKTAEQAQKRWLGKTFQPPSKNF
jgi:hypothetical protein